MKVVQVDKGELTLLASVQSKRRGAGHFTPEPFGNSSKVDLASVGYEAQHFFNFIGRANTATRKFCIRAIAPSVRNSFAKGRYIFVSPRSGCTNVYGYHRSRESAGYSLYI